MLPYIAILVVALLRRVNDAHPATRRAAAGGFALAVRLAPLDHGAGEQNLDSAAINDATSLPAGLACRLREDRLFLSVLLGTGVGVAPYTVPVPIAAELRPYQQEGISWLAFLRRSGLHGVLADDMGLGKSLQAIVTIASSRHERRTQGHARVPSLVVCPSSLVSHWVHEITRFCAPGVLRGIAYPSDAATRVLKLAARAGADVGNRDGADQGVTADDVIVVSYPQLRAVIKSLGKVKWHYLILDEGHIIRNAKSKLAVAVKRLVADCRVVLSGTPIQNNVLDLWSLFDFLMPGHLGEAAYFNTHFAKPVKAAAALELKLTSSATTGRAGVSRGRSKGRGDGGHAGARAASGGVMEGSARAIEELHKQCLPFVLRRLKDQVLTFILSLFGDTV
jgi:TATA-binding protein-associated factor